MTRELRFSLTGAAALLVALPLVAGAQTAPTEPKVFFACYGSLTGVVYRIKEPGLPTKCLHHTHVQFSWTSGTGGTPVTDHAALQGLGKDDHPQYLLVDGTRALAGALSAGGHKLTNLAAASADGEAVRYEQAVKSGDAAAGDLSGTYPDPTVAKLQGTAVSPTAPTNGQVLAFDGTSWSPAESPTGGSGTTGQNSISRGGTDALRLFLPGGAFQQVPGLTVGIEVPANSAMIVSTDGGVTTSSGEANAVVYVDIEVLIDGFPPIGGAGGRRRVVAMNTSGFGDVMANWSMQFVAPVNPGFHTVQVRAQLSKGNTSAIVSSDHNGEEFVSNMAQGVLTVTIIKR